MKMIQYFLLILLICATNSTVDGFTQKNCREYDITYDNHEGEYAFSLDFCRTTAYDNVNERCCFLQYEDENEITHYHCHIVSMLDFADIDEYIDNKLEGKRPGVVDLEILDCHSSYLYASLLLILALIF